MKELLMSLSFKQFLKTPFSWIFMAVICAFIYVGKNLLSEKDEVNRVYLQKIKDCDNERLKDKQLLQDIVFQKEIKNILNGTQDTIH